MTIAISGTNGITLDGQFNSASSMGFKNRILNGGMVIDQRNAGASITPTATVYSVDRWQATVNVASKASFDQTTTAPTGFTNSMLVTSLSAYSVAAGDVVTYRQQIEGFNIADLGWGTASAATITVSFWVRSSLTGTFGGSVKNGGSTRSYPFTYTISSANTWEQKSITIAGDTTGTWLTTTGIGIDVWWDLGCGSSNIGTAGSWAAAAYYGATGDTKLISTLNATFYITGVQLEVGSTATSFDYRPYGTELALCQRYLPAWSFPDANTHVAQTFIYSTTTSGPVILANPVAVRTPVTGLVVSAASNFSVSDGDSATACNAISVGNSSILTTGFSWGTATGRTAFRPHIFYTNASNALILGTGCEL